VESASEKLQERAMALAEFREASVVGCYLPLPGEPRTLRLLKECWKAGKATCVPAFVAEETEYRLARMTTETSLRVGPFGVREPTEPGWVALDSVDLIFVPGVAFDVCGCRTGHGGGHFDRLLERQTAAGQAKRLFKVGSAFEYQVFDEVPVGEHDVRLDAVVTENRTIRAHSLGT